MGSTVALAFPGAAHLTLFAVLPLFAVLAETGVRMSEALSLRHHDFHIGGDTPSVMIAGRHDHPHGVRAKSAAPGRLSGHRRSSALPRYRSVQHIAW
jgi:hypothetical protein